MACSTCWLDWLFLGGFFFLFLFRLEFPKSIETRWVNDLRCVYFLVWVWHYVALRTLHTCRLHPRDWLVRGSLEKFWSFLYDFAVFLLLNCPCLLLQLLLKQIAWWINSFTYCVCRRETFITCASILHYARLVRYFNKWFTLKLHLVCLRALQRLNFYFHFFNNFSRSFDLDMSLA